MTHQLASKEMVNQALSALAAKLIEDYQETKPLFICLLRGAAPFAMKLMMEITRQAPEFHPELDYMMVKTYGDKRTASQPQIVMDLAPSTDVNSRPVVVLDDVLDTGITAAFVSDTVSNRGASSVAVAVLVKKIIADQACRADYAAFSAGKEWLVGMGMDDSATAIEAFRWTEEIQIISGN